MSSAHNEPKPAIRLVGKNALLDISLPFRIHHASPLQRVHSAFAGEGDKTLLSILGTWRLELNSAYRWDGGKKHIGHVSSPLSFRVAPLGHD